MKKVIKRFSELERYSNSKITLLQYSSRSFWLEEILYATALLWSGDLRYTATLFLWTDRLHCVFPLFWYAGSGIRLGNEQINYWQRELGELFTELILKIWHRIFIPNGRTQSLQMQESMFQKIPQFPNGLSTWDFQVRNSRWRKSNIQLKGAL